MMKNLVKKLSIPLVSAGLLLGTPSQTTAQETFQEEGEGVFFEKIFNKPQKYIPENFIEECNFDIFEKLDNQRDLIPIQ